MVQLKRERAGVVHQVTLDPHKAKATDFGTIIRLGEWPGDEAAGWKFLGDILVVAVLGRAERVSEREVRVTPIA